MPGEAAPPPPLGAEPGSAAPPGRPGNAAASPGPGARRQAAPPDGRAAGRAPEAQEQARPGRDQWGSARATSLQRSCPAPPQGHPVHRPGGSSPPVTLKGAPRGPRAQRSCPRQGQGRTPIARRLAGQQRSCPQRDAPRAPQNLSPHFLLVQTLQMSRRCSPGCLGSLLSMCVLDSRNVLAFSRTFTRSPSFPQLHQRSLSLRPWSKGNK